MSQKRRNTSSPECEDSSSLQSSSPARSQEGLQAVPGPTSNHNGVHNSSTQPRVDVNTGQLGAFPGLGDDDDQMFYGPAADGLDYLRMVRSEARGIPQLLTNRRAAAAEQKRTANASNTRTHTENGSAFDTDSQEDDEEEVDQMKDQEGGYYHDGAYTARPEPQKNASTDAKFSHAQIHYYDALLKRYRVIRATVNCVPPTSSVQRFPTSRLHALETETPEDRLLWLKDLLLRAPHPVQIADLDGEDVLCLLRFIRDHSDNLFDTVDSMQIARLGAWIWSALGKCPDRGELGGEEIGDLRALAKQALRLSDSIQRLGSRHVLHDAHAELKTAYPHKDTPETIGGILTSFNDRDIMQGIQSARQRLQADTTVDAQGVYGGSEDSSSADGAADSTTGLTGTRTHQSLPTTNSQKLMIYDMVVTIVGEAYGQRDLLEMRKTWEETAGI